MKNEVYPFCTLILTFSTLDHNSKIIIKDSKTIPNKVGTICVQFTNLIDGSSTVNICAFYHPKICGQKKIKCSQNLQHSEFKSVVYRR